MINRRAFLGASLAAAGTLAVPSLALAGAAQPASRRLKLYNTHTGESIDVTYFEQGVYHREAMTEIDFLLRDFRVNQAEPMAREVIDIVHDLTAALDARGQVHIICGYRSPKTNEMLRTTRGGGVAKHSLHLEARAIDLRVPGRALADVRKAALTLGRGGVGMYSREGFVHVDNGRVRQWGA